MISAPTSSSPAPYPSLPPERRKLAHFAASPLPNKAFGFAGGPIGFVAHTMQGPGVIGAARCRARRKSPLIRHRLRRCHLPPCVGKALRAAKGLGAQPPGTQMQPSDSTRKGYAASVRRQSRQRLRNGCIWERPIPPVRGKCPAGTKGVGRSKGAGAVFAARRKRSLAHFATTRGHRGFTPYTSKKGGPGGYLIYDILPIQ